MTDKIAVFCSCASEEEALRIARHVVEARLAACVNVVPGVTSVYRWKGALEESREWLLVVKTRRTLFEALREAVERIHSYEVPEVVALPLVDGSPNYLQWLDRQLRDNGEPE